MKTIDRLKSVKKTMENIVNEQQKVREDLKEDYPELNDAIFLGICNNARDQLRWAIEELENLY